MSLNPPLYPSPGPPTPGLGGIMIRFKQGRTVYSANDVQRVCDHYISIAGSGIPVTIHVLQFLRNACLPFASSDALARLKTLPPPALQPMLDQHFNILLADDAPARLQTELESQPPSLFFVGNVVDFAHLQSLAPASPRKPAVRISRSFSQSALTILIRYEEGITLFPQQDIQTMLSYMKELNVRGADVWVSLVAFLRDAARPFASARVRSELDNLPTSKNQSDVAKQYNLLVTDGALDKLVEAAHTNSNPNFRVKAGGFQELREVTDPNDCQLPEEMNDQMPEKLNRGLLEHMTRELSNARDDEADDEADDETYDKENVDPMANRRIYSSWRSSSGAKPDDSPADLLVALTGRIGLEGNALPSLTKKRHHERNTRLTPRQIRDVVRQYDKNNSRAQLDLVAEKEVFYVGGKKRFQIRPEYFWVLVQKLDNDEPPITAEQMAAVCPHWESLVHASMARRIKSASPVIPESPQIPNEKCQSLGRDITLKEVADKLDALKDEVTALKDDVAAMARMNQELRQEIKELRDSSRSKPRNGVSSFSLSSDKKRRFDSDSGETDIVDTPTKKFGSMKLQKLFD